MLSNKKRAIKAVEKLCPKCNEMLVPLPGDYCKASCPKCTRKITTGIKEVWYCPKCYYVEVIQDG